MASNAIIQILAQNNVQYERLDTRRSYRHTHYTLICNENTAEEQLKAIPGCAAVKSEPKYSPLDGKFQHYAISFCRCNYPGWSEVWGSAALLSGQSPFMRKVS